MSIENFYQEEVVIRQLEEKERQAVLQHDIAALERLWAEEFIVNNPDIAKPRRCLDVGPARIDPLRGVRAAN